MSASFLHPRTWTNASTSFKSVYVAAGLSDLEDLIDSGAIPIAAAAALPVARSSRPAWEGGASTFTSTSTQPHDGVDHWAASMLPLLQQTPLQQVPAHVLVSCGALRGVFDVSRQRVQCLCSVCEAEAAAAGAGRDMLPTEFERHAGVVSQRNGCLCCKRVVMAGPNTQAAAGLLTRCPTRSAFSILILHLPPGECVGFQEKLTRSGSAAS